MRPGPLTDRSGAVNGCRTRRTDVTDIPPRIRRRRPWTQAAIAAWSLVAVVLLLGGAVAFLPPQAEPVRIDGDMSDWPAYIASSSVPHQEIPTQRAVYLRLQVGELEGARGLMDAVRIYMDVDGNPNTGYAVGSIGADYRILLWFWEGEVSRAEICVHQEAPPDLEAFAGCTGIPAAAGQGGVELGIARWWLYPSDLPAAWVVDVLRVDGPAVRDAWGIERVSWRQRAGWTDWRDGIHIDGRFDDWLSWNASVRHPVPQPWNVSSRHNVREVDRIVSRWNTSLLVVLDQAGLDGSPPAFRHIPPPAPEASRPPPSSGTPEPYRPGNDTYDDRVILVNASGDRIVVEGRAGRVMDAWYETNGSSSRGTAYAAFGVAPWHTGAFPHGLVEIQVAGHAWTGNFTVESASWDWSGADYGYVGSLAGSPNPPTPSDIAGNQKWFFRNTATSPPTICTTNVDASTTAGSSAAATTLNGGQSVCWYTAVAPGASVSGLWEVIVDTVEVASAEAGPYLPTAAGSAMQWSIGAGCAGGSEWQCMTSNDGDTSYLSQVSGLTGQQFLLNTANPALVTPLSVVNVNVTADCDTPSSGTQSVKINVKDSTTVAAGAAHTCAKNSYTQWTDSFATKPSGGAWDATNLNALQVGLQTNNVRTQEKRSSYIVYKVQQHAVYSVEIRQCTVAACTSYTTLYGPMSSNTYGNDVTFTSGTLAGQDCTAVSCRWMWVVSVATGGGTVRVRYNGANPGTDDSRATVPIPDVAPLAAIGIVLVVMAVPRMRKVVRKSRGNDALSGRPRP